ncbi:fibropellin-1-like [Rhopilema esculentum]|uniref:fibropellin-1-like n=1 Tax=Rhopilema esculentum TaxID=499914 RepID=UPI0031DD865D
MEFSTRGFIVIAQSALICYLTFTSTNCHILRLHCKMFANFSVKVEGHLLEGFTIAQPEYVDIHECFGHCLHNPWCRSVNVRILGSRTCQLNSRTILNSTNSSLLLKDQNWDFYTTDYTEKLIGQNCKARNPCPVNNLCIDTCDCPGYQCIENNLGASNGVIDAGVCASNPCKNGGTCVEVANQWLCNCRPGFIGAVCYPDCGQTLTGSSGVIASKNFPELYPRQHKCTWKIDVGTGFKVKLEFLSFNVEEDTHKCYDYVKITQGLSNSQILMECGTDLPGTITSTDSTVQIDFYSDNVIARTGFELIWSKI